MAPVIPRPRPDSVYISRRSAIASQVSAIKYARLLLSLGRRVVQEFFGTATKSSRLETERENLDYVLSNAELTEQEQGDVKHRLAVVEEELLQLFIAKLLTSRWETCRNPPQREIHHT